MNVPNEQWKPCQADLTSGTLCRSPDILLRVAKQFGVESVARYQPQRDGAGGIARTFCNIYAADVLQALGVVAPLHWWLGGELTANATADWLARNAGDYGWSSVSEVDARLAGSQGYPAIALWKNPTGGEGHVAIVLPSAVDGPTMIAQAGASNFVNGPLQNGFGSKQPAFWSHG